MGWFDTYFQPHKGKKIMRVHTQSLWDKSICIHKGGSVKPERPTKEKSWQHKVIIKLSIKLFSFTADNSYNLNDHIELKTCEDINSIHYIILSVNL